MPAWMGFRTSVSLSPAIEATGRLALASINEQARCQSSVSQSVGVSLAFTASYGRRKDFGQREISGRMQMFAGHRKFREGCKMFAGSKGNSLAKSCKRRKTFVWVTCGGPCRRARFQAVKRLDHPPFGVHGSDDAVARVMLKDRKS